MIIRLYIYLFILIYLFIYLLLFILRVRFNWSVFARQMRSTSEFAKKFSEQVCDSCWIRQGGMNPSGNACLSKELTLRNEL